MRNILIVLVMMGLMTTVGIYAASITGTTKTLGGTGSVTVTAPATAATVKLNTDANGNVTGGDVTWTPAANSAYTIKLVVGSSNGSLVVASSGTVSRTDTVAISPNVAPDAVTAAEAIISEN